MALFGRETEREQQRAEAWARWFRRQHPFAVASLVLGIFSLIEFGALLIFGIAGIAAGRPTAVPHHEPVRGFGSVSLTPKGQAQQSHPTDGPPPGTPKEFIGLPKVAPKKKKSAVDPDKVAKLKQKMKEQGMLGDED